MDREESLKIRLDIITKSKLIVFYIVLFLSLAFLLISMLCAPEMLSYDSKVTSMCRLEPKEHCFMQEGAFIRWEGKIQHVSLSNQLIFLLATPVYEKDLNYTMSVETNILGKDPSDKIIEKVITSKTETYHFDCKDKECDDILIIYDPYLEFENYDIYLLFLEEMKVEEIEFTLGYINHDFTMFQIFFKYLFFSVSVAAFVYYITVMGKVDSYLWNFESRVIHSLNVSLMLFNDPLFAFSIFFPSEFLSIISMFCITQFCFVLIYVWMLIFQYYAVSSYRYSLGVIEFFVVGGCFALLLSGYIFIHLEQRKNPAYNWQDDIYENYFVLYVSFLLLLCLCAVILLVFILKTIPVFFHLTKRRRFMMVYNIVTIVLVFVGVGVGIFQPFPVEGSMMLFFVGIFNLYVYILLFFYTPTKDSLSEYNNMRNLEISQIHH